MICTKTSTESTQRLHAIRLLLPPLLLLFAAVVARAGIDPPETELEKPAPKAPATQPKPADAPRVLIVSVDGLRPDVLLRADAPNLRKLMARGSFTMWAQTTAVSVTLPSHVSMLTGVKPQKHKIEWNRDLPFKEPVYPEVPTLFEFAKRAGYTTGLVSGKDKFAVLTRPGSLDAVFLPKEDVIPDADVLAEVLKVIDSESAPQVMFVHLPWVDHMGHQNGWASAQQIEAVHGADAAIGKMLDVLAARGVLERTLVIVSADHGGAGKKHGADDVRSRCIPWIAAGPGVRVNNELTLAQPDLTVRTEDTFATAMSFLGIPLPADIEGKPVRAAFEPPPGGELLAPVAADPKAVAPTEAAPGR